MYVYFKRFCDVVVSGIALVVLSPFLLVTAVLIKLESRGPVLFTPERLGVRGVP